MTEPMVTTEGSNSDSVEVAGDGTPGLRFRRKVTGVGTPGRRNSDSVEKLPESELRDDGIPIPSKSCRSRNSGIPSIKRPDSVFKYYMPQFRRFQIFAIFAGATLKACHSLIYRGIFTSLLICLARFTKPRQQGEA